LSITVLDTKKLDYPDAVRKAMSLADFERGTHSPGHSTFHLERIARLLDRLGNPHLDIPTVHVAGTKGKGSTAAIITSILSEAGYKTGLYTSPSLHTVTERVRVGMEPIDKQDFANLVDEMWPEVEWVETHGDQGPLMYFEFLTALAFLHFKQIGADFQVIEVGLGGRLDATNVVQPEVSVITSISIDHTAILGDTLALIAAEKAGIVKPGVPVVVAPQQLEAMETIRQIAVERGSAIVEVENSLSWQPRNTDLNGQTFEVQSLADRYEISTPLIGAHQQENTATAIATVETLMDKGYKLSKRDILDGLKKVRWPGRFQVLRPTGVKVIVDGAHNPYSMERLVETLGKHVEFDHAVVVFGAVSGHSVIGMFEELAVLAPTVIAAQSRHPKAAPVEKILEAAQVAGVDAVMEHDGVGVAVRRALAIATSGDLVLGTGSLSVVAEIIEEMEGVTPELYQDLKGVQRNDGQQRQR
jgi:dihydrofolate synthase/folylpolyglutamate synthase